MIYYLRVLISNLADCIYFTVRIYHYIKQLLLLLSFWLVWCYFQKIVWVLALTTKTKQKLQRWGKCFMETRNALWLIGLIINTETGFMTRHAIGSPVKNTKPACPSQSIWSSTNYRKPERRPFPSFPRLISRQLFLMGRSPQMPLRGLVS